MGCRALGVGSGKDRSVRSIGSVRSEHPTPGAQHPTPKGATVNLTSNDLAATTIKIVLAAGLTYSVYTDVRWGKIFNKITFPLILTGFFLNTLFRGFAGSLTSLEGFGAALG